MRKILIKEALNGFIVRVGCETLVFEEKAHLLNTLDEYINHPEEMEKRFIDKYGNNRDKLEACCPTPPSTSGISKAIRTNNMIEEDDDGLDF